MSEGSSRDFDVVVVGGSLAGASAATLYARRGLRVALLEKKPKMDAYKVVCAHYIQGGATPMLRRHGFDKAIEAAGGVRIHAELWTRFGWVRGEAEDYGYSLRRQVLDPMLRRIAAETPGVELLLGHTVTDLTWSDGRVNGVEVATREGGAQKMRAPLVVAADGRESRLARMARVPGRVLPHHRFAYWAYVRGLPRPADGAAQGWLLDPDIALINPCDDDLTCVIASPVKARLPEFKTDLESAWLRYIEALPDGPDIREAERVSKFIGKLEYANVQRPGAKNGMAFIGDAAISSDPIWAVGCGWALESSEWLVDSTADRLRDGRDVESGLRRYRWRHGFELTGHHVFDSYYSTGRPFNAIEKLLFAAGARDTMLARGLHTYVTRAHPAHDFIKPRTFARAMKVLASSRQPDLRPPVYQSKPSTNGGAPHSSSTNGSPREAREVAAARGGGA